MSSSGDNRPTKRQRTEATAAATSDNPGDNSGEEDVLLKALLVDDDEDEDFATDEQRRTRLAEERRRARQQRLLQVGDEPPKAPPVTKNQTTSPARSALAAVAKEREDINDSNEDEEEDDGFDMFSSSVSPVLAESKTPVASDAAAAATTAAEHGTQQDWDDAEGYYKAVIGEVISLETAPTNDRRAEDSGIRFRVSGLIGKGVFSSVLKCATIHNSTSTPLPPVVAIKCIRHNETMAKAAYNEIRFLQRFKSSPGIVPLLLPTTASPLEHRGHVLLIFPFADYNLREVLQKFGRGVGLSLEAVRSYFGQLLAAATQLKKHGLIHADLKPDNILINADFSVVQLGDFGSAVDVSSASQQQQPTPYLVSRFYRAPEIILGLVPTHAVDLWSLGVTVAELFLGNVLFTGRTNNDMLYVFMQHLGPFSNRLIRQHLVQCNKMPIPRQFVQRQEGAGSDFLFIQHSVDPVTNAPVNKYVSLVSNKNSHGNDGTNGGSSEVFPSTPLSKKLLKAKSAKDSRTMVLRFADLLQKCLALDPARRISLKDALRHDFFTKGASHTAEK